MGVGKNTTIKRPLLPIDGTDTQNTVQYTIKMIGRTMPYSQYLKIIREAVATDNVLYSYHARTRMNERGITRIMVTEALVRGVIKRPPERNTHGAIEVKLNRYSAGMNYSVVVAVIDGEVVVTVVTVY